MEREKLLGGVFSTVKFNIGPQTQLGDFFDMVKNNKWPQNEMMSLTMKKLTGDHKNY